VVHLHGARLIQQRVAAGTGPAGDGGRCALLACWGTQPAPALVTWLMLGGPDGQAMGA
jgi:hypothetical protein